MRRVPLARKRSAVLMAARGTCKAGAPVIAPGMATAQAPWPLRNELSGCVHARGCPQVSRALEGLLLLLLFRS